MSDQFPKKWDKFLSDDFKSAAEEMKEDELKATIVSCSKKSSEVEKAMDEDPDLKKAKDEVKELSKGYKEILNEQNAKVKFCVFVLKQRGNG